MAKPLAVIVLAAGLGTRTRVAIPKVLLPLCGKSLLDTVLDTVAGLGPAHTVVVLHHGKERVEQSLAQRQGLVLVDQGEPRGTGHAVQVAMQALPDFDGDILVVYGDVPLISVETLVQLRVMRASGAACVLTAYSHDPSGMGRILRDEADQFLGIREEKDCSAEERQIQEFNAGFYCFDAQHLPKALAQLDDNNAQGELYLTDTLAGFLAAGLGVNTVTLEDAEEVMGVNNLEDLALVRQVMQERILMQHLLNGVIIEDPNTTYIDAGVSIGPGTRILPCTVIRAGVQVGANCEVGPFTHLRVGTVMDDGSEVGNFVEAKKSYIGPGTKAKHLTYLGDTTIGAGSNIGAGTITANYDGKAKHPTVIGDQVFVGSGTVLVAPSKLEDRSMTGAGAIVTRNTHIKADEVYVGVPARPINVKKPIKESKKC